MLHVIITYDDMRVEAPVSEWPQLRGDGVQEIRVGKPNNWCSFQGASLYWVYPEGENIIVGCGSVRYDPNHLTEICIATDGLQTERRREYMPDLKHNQIKLGWWKRG